MCMYSSMDDKYSHNAFMRGGCIMYPGGCIIYDFIYDFRIDDDLELVDMQTH